MLLLHLNSIILFLTEKYNYHLKNVCCLQLTFSFHGHISDFSYTICSLMTILRKKITTYTFFSCKILVINHDS